MTPLVPYELLRAGLMMLLVVGGPILALLLTSGLVVGALQATTQINDPAVGFLPRFIVLLVVCALGGQWIMEHLAEFLRYALTQIASG